MSGAALSARAALDGPFCCWLLRCQYSCGCEILPRNRFIYTPPAEDFVHSSRSGRSMRLDATSIAEASAEVAAAADAALKAPTLPEKEGRARLHALISSLRARGARDAGVDLSRVQVINGERLRKLLVSLRQLLCGRAPKLRPVALRVLRYLCHTDEAIVLMREEFLDIFVARSLEREAVHMQERAAALRIFDHLAMLQPKSLTASLMAAVVAVAEHAGDPLRNVRSCTAPAPHVHCTCTLYAEGGSCALQFVHC